MGGGWQGCGLGFTRGCDRGTKVDRNEPFAPAVCRRYVDSPQREAAVRICLPEVAAILEGGDEAGVAGFDGSYTRQANQLADEGAI